MARNESLTEDQIESMFEEASEHLASDEMSDARKLLKKLIEVVPNSPWTIELCGDFALHRGEQRKAEKEYRRMTVVSNEPLVRIRSAISLAALYVSESRTEEACESYTQALALADEHDKHYYYVQICSRLADEQLTLGQVERAAEVLQSGIDCLLNQEKFQDQTDESHRYEVASMQRSLSTALRMLGRIAEAERLLANSLMTFESLGLSLDVAETQDCLAVIRQIQGRYDEAEVLLNAAIEVNLEFENEEGLSVNYGNMSFLCRHREDYDKAEHYLRLAYEIDKEHEREDAIADYYVQLGEIQYRRQQFDEAEANILKGLKLIRRLEDRFAEGVTYSHLGILYRLKQDYTKSEELTRKALAISEEVSNLDAIASVLDELATVQKAQDRVEEARATWKRSLEIFEQIGSLRMIEEVKQHLESLN